MISIIIPAYNEEHRIERAILEVLRYCSERALDGDIIVVDDGSTDKTAIFAMKHKGVRCIQNGKNMGKGYSVRRGFREARGEIILFTDADLSTPINQADRLLDKIKEGFDIAIGSRALPGSKIDKYQPPLLSLIHISEPTRPY